MPRYCEVVESLALTLCQAIDAAGMPPPDAMQPLSCDRWRMRGMLLTRCESNPRTGKLSPAHFMVTPDGEITFCADGIARILYSDGAWTIAGRLMFGECKRSV